LGPASALALPANRSISAKAASAFIEGSTIRSNASLALP
jgi:hypothetical protein